MNETELSKESMEVQLPPEPEHASPVLLDWTDSEWFSVWLKIARHEPMEAAD